VGNYTYFLIIGGGKMKVLRYFDGEYKIAISELTTDQAARILTALDQVDSELADEIRTAIKEGKNARNHKKNQRIYGGKKSQPAGNGKANRSQ
jgi:hypothetical protein